MPRDFLWSNHRISALRRTQNPERRTQNIPTNKIWGFGKERILFCPWINSPFFIPILFTQLYGAYTAQRMRVFYSEFWQLCPEFFFGNILFIIKAKNHKFIFLEKTYWDLFCECVHFLNIAVLTLSAIRHEIKTTDGHPWNTDKSVLHPNEKRYSCWFYKKYTYLWKPVLQNFQKYKL